MKRLIMNDLVTWSKKETPKPLFILGSRQIGKTYIVKEFGEQYFTNKYVYFNFLDKSINYDIFKKTTNPMKIIQAIEILTNKRINNESLIIFDEIQEMPNIRSSLKHFVEQKLNYKIICLGSYLGNVLNDKESFPVGKIDRINMYPMNFEEFLLALNQDDLIKQIKDSINSMKPLTKTVDEYLNFLLKEFLMVGGMPEAINEYLMHKNYNDSKRINNQLIDDYKSDMIKYIESNSDKTKCIKLFENIPVFLAKENKKYKLSNIDKTARYLNYDVAINTLTTTNIAYKIENLNTFSSPASLHKKESEFKVYYNNPGFISSIFNLNNSILFENNEYCNIRGALFENYVLSELVQKISKNNIYYYAFRDHNNNPYEIDFCIEDINGDLIPIEVKSSKEFTRKSLVKLNKDKKQKYSIIFSFKELGFDKANTIYKIPLYAIGFLHYEDNRLKINIK